jgi:hypothetical protein
MKVKVDLILDSVQVIRRSFDKKGRVAEEQIEYYSPSGDEMKKVTIGFDLETKVKKTK